MSDLTKIRAAVAANTVAIDNAAAVAVADKATIAQQAATIVDLQAQLAAASQDDTAELNTLADTITADDAKLPVSTGA